MSLAQPSKKTRTAARESEGTQMTAAANPFYRALRTCAVALLPLSMAACGWLPLKAPPLPPPAPTPERWQAPLPHNGTLTDLTQWWQQLGDPLLVELIASAQEVSPTMASARARIAQARATRVQAGAALLPGLDAVASGSRGFNQQLGRIATTGQVGVQASWEVDLFGGNAATRDAAQARYEGAQADWHDARVSVAAEVANLYFSLRNCERLLAVSRFDARSRAESMRLTDLMMRAGFQAPGTLALARASSAEGAVRVTQQRALCDLDIKGLVALASLDETRLREKLAEVPASMGRPPNYAINSLPASLLEQRPDIFSAERELMAARAEIGAAQAQRYPRLSLNGTVGAAYVRVSGVSDTVSNWSIGPVTLSLPLFDGGTRSAQVEAAEARYEAAAVLYRARARQAVREVEEALVQLQSVSDRNDDALIATQGYRESFNATEARYKSGLASLVELEDSRRLALASETTLVTLQRERMAAWVALYRAAGGGWTQSSTGPRFETSPVPAAAASKP